MERRLLYTSLMIGPVPESFKNESGSIQPTAKGNRLCRIILEQPSRIVKDPKI